MKLCGSVIRIKADEVYAGIRVRGSVHCNDLAMLLMSYDCNSLCQRQLVFISQGFQGLCQWQN